MNEPSVVFTVVVYTPSPTASVHEIKPEALTFNPGVSGNIEKLTSLFEAFSGATTAVNCLVPAVPATAEEVFGDSVTPEAGIVTPPPTRVGLQ